MKPREIFILNVIEHHYISSSKFVFVYADRIFWTEIDTEWRRRHTKRKIGKSIPNHNIFKVSAPQKFSDR